MIKDEGHTEIAITVVQWLGSDVGQNLIEYVQLQHRKDL